MGLRNNLIAIFGSLVFSAAAAGKDDPKIPVIEWEETVIRANPNNQTTQESLDSDLEAKCTFDPQDLERYLKWKQECIDFSQKNRHYCLLVNKVKRELIVYKEETALKSYPIELGWSPYDDKMIEGDGCTPEGRYNIKEVKKHSKFHEALLIDYPNQKDKEEFAQLKKENKILKDTRIGGQIQIHGNGSEENPRGDWTAGCVALSDTNIDELYKTISPDKNKRRIAIYVIRYDAKEEKCE